MLETIGILITVVFFIFLCKCLFNHIRAVVLRVKFYFNLRALCTKNNYKTEYPRNLFASFFKYSSKPDIIIKADGIEYILRFITCKARKRTYFFMTSEHYLKCMKLYFAMPLARASTDVDMLAAYKYIPPVKERYTSDTDGIERRTVFLFNPAPVDITTVNSSGTGRVVVGNGSVIDGCLAYNGNGFINFLKED